MEYILGGLIMKNALIILLSLFTLAACGTKDSASVEEKQADSEKKEEESSQSKKELTREEEITNLVTERVENEYNSTSITDIRVNEDLGEGEGYIVLVDLSFDQKNKANTAKDMIEMYGTDLAAYLGEKTKDINEVVTFWQAPYLQEDDNNIAKIATERVKAGMAITDEMFNTEIFK